MTLTEFLLARIAEDEAVARAAIEAGGAPASASRIFTSLLRPTGTVEVPPDRVLAECAAKRAIVATTTATAALVLALPDSTDQEFVVRAGARGALSAFETACALLALPYADHPDYDEAWRP
jgi:Family of unknown function (DUF6221)